MPLLKIKLKESNKISWNSFLVKVKVFVFNYFAENMVILWEEATKETAVVDPGMSNQEEEKIFDEFIHGNSLKIKYLINTHCHIDHILGCSYVKEKYRPAYYVPEKDVILLRNAAMQAEMFGLKINQLPEPDKFISEDIVLNLGNSKLNFLFTPGHTAGEFCIYLNDEKICITGDVLFKEGIGRTDLWGGDYDLLIQSIEKKLCTLPDDVTIYPGHGDASSIGYEKKYNPFLV